MAKDVFVSYSTQDQLIADKLCSILEGFGLHCWIAPRDIPPGAEFELEVLRGIDESQAMVVVLTPAANASAFVANEVNRAFSKGNPIFTFRVQDIKPSRALEFYLARHQWTDGFPPPVDERIARMARALLELVGRPSQHPSIRTAAEAPQNRQGANAASTRHKPASLGHIFICGFRLCDLVTMGPPYGEPYLNRLKEFRPLWESSGLPGNVLADLLSVELTSQGEHEFQVAKTFLDDTLGASASQAFDLGWLMLNNSRTIYSLATGRIASNKPMVYAIESFSRPVQDILKNLDLTRSTTAWNDMISSIMQLIDGKGSKGTDALWPEIQKCVELARDELLGRN